MNPAKFIPYLEATARNAGARIMEIYAEAPKAEYKDDGSPVTLADQIAEDVILKALMKIAPEVEVISEENAASHSKIPTKNFFLVDALDGTKEFLKRDGHGSFTVNIALIEYAEPVLGIIYAPAFDRMFTGVKGGGAREHVNGSVRSIRVRVIPSAGALAVASYSHRDEETDRWLSDHEINETISIGSSLKFCLIACGEADVYPRFGPTMEWDTAAGDAVLRAAGGLVTHLDGSIYTYGKKNYRNTGFVAWGQKQKSASA